jgi:hypothetical protein
MSLACKSLEFQEQELKLVLTLRQVHWTPVNYRMAKEEAISGGVSATVVLLSNKIPAILELEQNPSGRDEIFKNS